VIDYAELSDSRESDAEFFVQFAADSLFGALTCFDSTSGWPMKEGHGLRILDFRDKECIFMTN